MKVKTHRITNGDSRKCEFCEKQAAYWSQVENGEKAESRCVFHCQTHRDCAREKAMSLVSVYQLHRRIVAHKLNQR